MKGFKESETKTFINYVKANGDKDLSKIFKEYALISGRAQGSVRNYYYKTVKECKTNEKLRQKLGVSKEMFPSFIKEFLTSEAEDLLKSVLKGVAEGKSVRSVISALSNGNEKLALRYQNKYRNLLKNDRQLVLKVASKIVDKNGQKVNPYKSEKDDAHKKIEGEIDCLIKKIVKVLKDENQALIEKNELLIKENEKLKEIFKKTLKDREIDLNFIIKSSDTEVI